VALFTQSISHSVTVSLCHCGTMVLLSGTSSSREIWGVQRVPRCFKEGGEVGCGSGGQQGQCQERRRGSRRGEARACRGDQGGQAHGRCRQAVAYGSEVHLSGKLSPHPNKEVHQRFQCLVLQKRKKKTKKKLLDAASAPDSLLALNSACLQILDAVAAASEALRALPHFQCPRRDRGTPGQDPRRYSLEEHEQ